MNDFTAGSAADRAESADKTRLDADRDRLGMEDLTLLEVRDVLWLARCIGTSQRADREEQDVPVDAGPAGTGDAGAEPSGDTASKSAEKSSPQTGENWVTGGKRHVYSMNVDQDAHETTAALASPTLPALSNARRLAQALRPFTMTSPSPWRTLLDEEATAMRAAEDGLWLPQWQPAPWHRFDVALVVDTGPSMEVWRSVVGELRELLSTLGAFRDVRTYFMDFSRPLVDQLMLKPEGRADVLRHWRELVDPTGRRLVLVVTDAIGAGWHSGAASQLLARWAHSMPLAVVQTLAQRLWHWSALSPRRVELSAPVPGAPNRQLRVRAAGAQWFGGAGQSRGTVVPVLALTPEWFAGWAKLVAQPANAWVETTAVITHPLDSVSAEFAEPSDLPEDDGTARDQVLRFRTVASAEAFQLAGLLAAAPLTLPAMREVQRVLLPNSDISALAEVLLGGLLRRLPVSAFPSAATTPAFEFHDGVREELLAGGRRSDTVRVARLMGDYGRNVAVLRNFREAVDNPESAEYPEATAENLPYLRVQEALFRALSGRHAARAKRINRELHRLIEVSEGTSRRVDGTTTEVPLDSETIHSSGSSTDQASEQDHAVTTTEPLPQMQEPQFQTAGGNVTAPGFSHTVDGSERGAQPRVWGQIPLRNPDFVGRETLLEQLRSQLDKPGAAAAVLPETLHGMGGVGKTQTVTEYIYRHAREYDVIWWVSAEYPAQIRASFVELAAKLGVAATENAETAVPSVLEALRMGEPFRRWLLVFDNADRPDVVRPFLPTGPGHVIVTSRNSQWSGVARTIEVDLFTREESEELLRRRDGSIEISDAQKLAEALGDLPLAIEQAAAWRSQTGMPVTEYLQLLDENRTELLEAGASGDYDLPVAAAWNVALSRLRSEHPAALELLRVCSFFGPTAINREVFTRARSVPVPDSLREALADPIKFNRAIREISRYSLAKIDHRSNTLQLHRLVQAVLRNQVDEAEQEGMRHVVHLLLAGGDPGDPAIPANWGRYDDLLSHVTASLAIRCDDEWVQRLITNLLRYLLNIGDYDGARELSGQRWQALREKLGESHLDTLETARQHGVALRRSGHLQQAFELNERTYRMLAQSVSEDSERMLTMSDVIATDLRAQGQFGKERDMRQKVYQRAREIFGEDDPDTLRYAHNLSGALRLLGEFFKAKELDEDIWQRKTVVLGAEHAVTAASLNAFAIDLRECGQYAEASRIQEEALARQRALFGDDRAVTYGAGRSLAVAKLRMGEAEAARDLLEEWYERTRRRVGEVHEDTATVLLNLSTSHRMLGNLTKALELGQRSMEHLTQTHGSEHPFTLIAATNVAVVHRLRGHADSARELNERVLSAFHTTFTRDHPFALTTATNLASDLAALGESTKARELDADTHERSTRVLGPEHPTTLIVALNLSLDLSQLGRVDDAAILHTKTLRSLRAVLGDDHPISVAATEPVRVDVDTDTMQL
ncbi:FxSxx-COOH system tetratricopeptide repeat protein [Saccharopolyspora sp. K220]|uniref:FxSxx-COOH system tetratricopeptide repeat protein n=1 Tax=Saccharopolyspora soli TaxID=2926618 RepID=UPI001F578E0E|nr:FxSxx-COOH system tetratricopeptide repeat protein [Saccharopolyspora soli]MCI2420107.1 FxSxx-COOH system tetratricopeptide repeat protein [Saccharopolyspora soli]